MSARSRFHQLAMVVLAAVAVLTSDLSYAGWKAGRSAAVITPPQAMPMAGYASRGAAHAEGKLTDLWAKVLILEGDGGHQACLITMDIVGIDRGLADSICGRLMSAHGWTRDQIAICTSHTHCGPVIRKNLRPMHFLMFDEADQKLVLDYAQFAEDAVVKTVAQAREKLAPAELRHGSGRATFAVNRRNNRDPDVPMLREQGMLKGPVDHDVPVLIVKQDGKPSTVVFGYACHCTTLGTMEWSGDYAGFAQIELEKAHPGIQAMFWAGCGGDQNPIPRREVALAMDYGRRLASAVEAVLSAETTPIAPVLSTTYREIELPFAPLPTQADLEKDTQSDNKYIQARAKSLLADLSEGKELSKAYPYPIQVWKLGKEVRFVTLGGEVVVDYAIRIKEELGRGDLKPTGIWCAGYTNDVMAYIPSLRVLQEGGYEGGGAMIYYGLPTVWAPEVEEMIVKAVHDLAK